MKNKIIFILPILIFSLIACANQKKTTSKSSKSTMSYDYVQMRRTACFGRCPMYNVELYKNGRLKYTGVRFVKDSGVYEKNIGAAAAEKIFNEFRRYRVDTCSEEYSRPIADLPGIYYNITLNGEERKIANAHFGPNFLKELAQKMDEVGYDVDHSSWKKLTN